jgi:hypothetical protein
MNKRKDIIEDKIKLSKELRDSLDNLMNMLEEHGWELNDDGDIVDKKSKRLVWEIIHGIKEE